MTLVHIADYVQVSRFSRESERRMKILFHMEAAGITTTSLSPQLDAIHSWRWQVEERLP